MLPPFPTMPHMIPRRAAALLAAATLSLLAATTPAQAQDKPAEAPKDYSLAERLLFMRDQLGAMKPPTTLRYQFTKTGALESGLQGGIDLVLTKATGGRCCAAEVRVADRAIGPSLPTVEQASGNPVLLFFLDRDVREMHRLTRGSEAYYRKRIRMAVFEGARVTDVSLAYKGRSVRGKRIDIAPYDGDPARSRFEKHARKTYQFDLSDEVPGGVHAIRSIMRDADDKAPPMIVEELRLDGATPSSENPR